MESLIDQKLPTHLAFILDGNRRWAKARGKPSLIGHKVGYENFKEIIKAAQARGIRYVSAYIFSQENWKRSKQEVNYLMKLTLNMFKRDVEELHARNIRIIQLGESDRLDPKIVKAIERAEAKTADNNGLTVGLCYNYGGQQEIVEAVRSIVSSKIDPNDISIDTITQNIYHPELPPIDLVIRTSGEQRISNFMLWRIAYAELYFTEVYWPDFTEADLDKALDEYIRRHRRFGS